MNTTITNPQDYAVGAVVDVDPSTLLLQRNVRDAQVDPDLVRSIKDVGVLQPITAVLTAEGALLVRFGERRTLSAIEAQRPSVKVYITAEDSAEKEAEVLRIVSQRDENTHRKGMSTADDLRVVEQLSLMGLSAAQVAKRARIKRNDVDTALSVIGSTIAHKAVDRYEALTLEQAAIVAEFEDDAEVVKALVVAATTGQFGHVAQSARDDRAEATDRESVLTALAEAGVTVMDKPAHDDKATHKLTRLATNSKTINKPITVDEHAGCAGHVAWLDTDWVYVDVTGARVQPPTRPADGADEAAWEAFRAEGSRQRTESRQVLRAVAVYGCTGWAKNGHVDRHATTNGSSRVPAAQMSDEQRAKAKAERKLVIDNNKAWSASQPVRRDFVATLAKAKTAPKGTARFLASALCLDPSVSGSVGGNGLAAEWLGKKSSGYGYTDLSPAQSATEARALVVALVQMLGGYENGLTDSCWRSDGTHNATGRYLRFLQTCGYVLSDVEKYAISKKRA